MCVLGASPCGETTSSPEGSPRNPPHGSRGAQVPSPADPGPLPAVETGGKPRGPGRRGRRGGGSARGVSSPRGSPLPPLRCAPLLPARLPLPLAGATPPLEPAQCGGERSPSALPCPALAARGADSAGDCRPAPSGVAAGAGGRAAPRHRPARALMGLAEPAPWPPCTRARTRPPRPRRTSCWR